MVGVLSQESSVSKDISLFYIKKPILEKFHTFFTLRMSNDGNSKHDDPQSKDFNAKDWGYDMYPERSQKFQPGIGQILLGYGREHTEKLECEENVFKCFKKSPMVKLLMGAMKSAGW